MQRQGHIVRIQRKLQTIRHPHMHQLQIRTHQIELLSEGRHRFVQARYGSAQIRDQAAQHRRCLRRTGIDQLPHIRQRIEQKMRLDLRLQQTQARIQRLAFQLTAFQFKGEGLMACQRILLPHQRTQRHPWRQHHADHRQHDETAQAILDLPERWRTGCRRDDIDCNHSDRHHQRHTQHLQGPACEPCGQASRPLLEDPERQHAQHAHNHSAYQQGHVPRLPSETERQADKKRCA